MTDTVPTAHSSQTTPNPPPTPDGYDEPYLFEYSTVILLLLSVPIGLFSLFGFGWVLWRIQGPEVFVGVFDVTETEGVTTIALDLTGVFITLIITLIVVVIVHELIHGAVMQYYGREVTYGVNLRMGAFYTAAFGQFQEIDELRPIALAPLVVITGAIIPLLFVQIPIIAITAYLVLVVNTTGAVGDMYVLWRLRRMPKGTLMYDANLHHWYVFEPLKSGDALN